MSGMTRMSSRASAIVFIACSLTLFAGALGLFIWLVADASEMRMVRNVFYGSAFLVITLGMLLYSLLERRSPRLATALLAAGVILGVASFVTGICFHHTVARGIPETVSEGSI